MARLEGIEPPHSDPESDALSTELQALVYKILYSIKTLLSTPVGKRLLFNESRRIYCEA